MVYNHGQKTESFSKNKYVKFIIIILNKIISKYKVKINLYSIEILINILIEYYNILILHKMNFS